MPENFTNIFDRVCAFLSAPETHQQVEPIDVVTTHAARIFLAKSVAYKIKIPIKYDYLDFSTLEKRKAICERELQINQPYAPKIYRDVVAIRQSDTGELGLGSKGIPVEWAVRMNRFPEANVLFRMVERGDLNSEIARDLGHMIARFHQNLVSIKTTDGAKRIEEIVSELEREFSKLEDYFDGQQQTAFFIALRRMLHANVLTLDTRAKVGMVKRCHGDMHLRNIVMMDGHPTLFDALEFDERLATTDVLYDLAFLLMDMAHEELGGQSSTTFNRYASEAWPQLEKNGFAVMPLFLSIRAAIRAMVTAQTGLRNPNKREKLKREASEYFLLADEFLRRRKPVLVAISGYSGTGKSTLAERLVPTIGNAPGALLLRSDLERKTLLGIDEFEKVPSEFYKSGQRKIVYDRILEKAAKALKQGQSVVLDAVFSDVELRSKAAHLADASGANFLGCWLSAPDEVLFARILKRKRDASDATIDVVRAQLENAQKPEFTKEHGWQDIDASGDIDETVAAVRKILNTVRSLKQKTH